MKSTSTVYPILLDPLMVFSNGFKRSLRLHVVGDCHNHGDETVVDNNYDHSDGNIDPRSCKQKKRPRKVGKPFLDVQVICMQLR